MCFSGPIHLFEMMLELPLVTILLFIEMAQFLPKNSQQFKKLEKFKISATIQKIHAEGEPSQERISRVFPVII